MDIRDRLQIIISKNNLNASSFAEKLKIQRSNLSHILSGRNKPSLDFIEKFISNYPEEDVLWLITGNENKNKLNITRNYQQNESINDNQYFTKKESKQNKREIKIITFYEDNTFDVFYPNS
jgi:transcriptional regulator with XRE-family HTH domain